MHRGHTTTKDLEAQCYNLSFQTEGVDEVWRMASAIDGPAALSPQAGGGAAVGGDEGAGRPDSVEGTCR